MQIRIDLNHKSTKQELEEYFDKAIKAATSWSNSVYEAILDNRPSLKADNRYGIERRLEEFNKAEAELYEDLGFRRMVLLL